MKFAVSSTKIDYRNIVENRIATMQKFRTATTRWIDTGEDKTKRLTIDVSEPIHKALKIKAVTEGVTMAEIVRQLLMQQFGQDSG